MRQGSHDQEGRGPHGSLCGTRCAEGLPQGWVLLEFPQSCMCVCVCVCVRACVCVCNHAYMHMGAQRGKDKHRYNTHSVPAPFQYVPVWCVDSLCHKCHSPREGPLSPGENSQWIVHNITTTCVQTWEREHVSAHAWKSLDLPIPIPVFIYLSTYLSCSHARSFSLSLSKLWPNCKKEWLRINKLLNVI